MTLRECLFILIVSRYDEIGFQTLDFSGALTEVVHIAFTLNHLYPLQKTLQNVQTFSSPVSL